jgi:phenazine biosynthesis-like protein
VTSRANTPTSCTTTTGAGENRDLLADLLARKSCVLVCVITVSRPRVTPWSLAVRAPIFQLDSFTTKRFAGNPAAVVVLEEFLPDASMQAIAAESFAPSAPT